jgi:hypothetical protein
MGLGLVYWQAFDELQQYENIDPSKVNGVISMVLKKRKLVL